MARNKYPEQTVLKITETAARLFMERGYDNTSIQDVIDQLGGLSKGAIYHHFRSKEEILNAVMEYIYSGSEEAYFKILKDPCLTGFQKINRMLDCSISSAQNRKAFALSLNMMKNPHILAVQLESSVGETAELLMPAVLQGIEDGSLPAMRHPFAFTQVFLLLSNIWLNPMVFFDSYEEIREKCLFLREILHALGVQGELIDDGIMEKICHLREMTIIRDVPQPDVEEPGGLSTGMEGDAPSGKA